VAFVNCIIFLIRPSKISDCCYILKINFHYARARALYGTTLFLRDSRCTDISNCYVALPGSNGEAGCVERQMASEDSGKQEAVTCR